MMGMEAVEATRLGLSLAMEGRAGRPQTAPERVGHAQAHPTPDALFTPPPAGHPSHRQPPRQPRPPAAGHTPSEHPASDGNVAGATSGGFAATTRIARVVERPTTAPEPKSASSKTPRTPR